MHVQKPFNMVRRCISSLRGLPHWKIFPCFSPLKCLLSNVFLVTNPTRDLLPMFSILESQNRTCHLKTQRTFIGCVLSFTQGIHWEYGLLREKPLKSFQYDQTINISTWYVDVSRPHTRWHIKKKVNQLCDYQLTPNIGLGAMHVRKSLYHFMNRGLYVCFSNDTLNQLITWKMRKNMSTSMLWYALYPEVWHCVWRSCTVIFFLAFLIYPILYTLLAVINLWLNIAWLAIILREQMWKIAMFFTNV